MAIDLCNPGNNGTMVIYLLVLHEQHSQAGQPRDQGS
jgi:hypothetical protein